MVALLALLAACERSAPPTGPAPAASPAAAAPAPPSPPQAAPREARAKSLAPDGAEIRYRVYGQGEPAIVFIHGWSCDSSYWDPQLNALAERHTVVTLDLAGHGGSPAGGREEWSMARFGSDVAAVVRDAGLDRVVLAGSSMGGTVALEAARQLPGQVIGIVGVDTFRDLAAPYAKELTDPLLAGLRADFPGTVAAFVSGNFFTERTDPIVKRWIVEDMAAAPPEVAIPAMEALLAMDYGPLLAELDLPIVAVNAADSPTDEAAIRRLEPRFRVVALPGVGHFPMLEQPLLFNRVLERIVSEWARLEAERKPLPGAAPAG
jgi:pimeloyl-ACP methyl ester carboxylesterase